MIVNASASVISKQDFSLYLTSGKGSGAFDIPGAGVEVQIMPGEDPEPKTEPLKSSSRLKPGFAD